MKQYEIQHDYLFENINLEEPIYKKDVPNKPKEFYGNVYLFSKILIFKNDSQFENYILKFLPSLFKPLLLIDEWPNKDDINSLSYSRFLLRLVLNKLKEYNIEPLISFNL